MKRFLILSLSALFATSLFAQKRTIHDCTEYDGEKYKVVGKDDECLPTTPKPKPPKAQPKPKPKPKPKPRPCPPCPSSECAPCPACPPAPPPKVEERKTYNQIEIYGLAGYVQDGMKASTQSEGEQVDKYYGFGWGGGIDYNINENFSIGILGTTTGVYAKFGAGFFPK